MIIVEIILSLLTLIFTAIGVYLQWKATKNK